jgi:muconolactone delta-isomerase
MRFLILSQPKHPPPPSPEIFDATSEWINRWQGTGKMEQAFAYAGKPGGGGILDVESHEELDEIMSGFPFGPFSELQVIPLTDLHAALGRGKEAVAQMMAAQGATPR